MNPWGDPGDENFCYACARPLKVFPPHGTDELLCECCLRVPEACPCSPAYDDTGFLPCLVGR